MIKIEISCLPEEVDAHLKALGLMKKIAERQISVQWAVVEKPETEQEAVAEAENPTSSNSAPEQPSVSGDASTKAAEPQHETAPGAVAMDGDRERGKAGPGHRRRTNEQIKSDDAYFASLPKSEPLAPGSEAPLISTGEERLDSRDAADEAAETAARKSDKPTREDLRAAVGRYTEKFGPKASIDNIRQIIGKPIIEVTEDEMAAAIARVEKATTEEVQPINPEPVEAPQATKADVVEAIRAYGKKYDGESDDPKKMPFTQEDMPKIFAAAFGPGVVGLKTAPQTPEGLGKALAAVNAAVRDNPFKREAKG
jgi:hypothetical protein